jgi:hypothetical protein
MSTPPNQAGVTQDNERVGRPTWVWVICAYYALGTVGTVRALSLLHAGTLPMTSAQAQYFHSLSTFQYGATLTVSLINAVAVVLLFLMRKPAAYLFPIGFVIGLIMAGFNAFTTGWAAALGVLGLVGAVLGWAIGIAVCLYVWRLLRRGMLR